MQTLNVDITRNDTEHQAAEEQRRAELRADARREANFFFLAAAVAALGTGVALIQLGILVRIGAIDLLIYYGRIYGQAYPLVVLGTAFAWIGALIIMGFIARAGHRGAFLAGIVLYGLDMILLIATFSLGSFGVHAFFLYRWYLGHKALKEAEEIPSSN